MGYRDFYGLPTAREFNSRAVETSVSNDTPKVRTRYNLGHWEAMQANFIIDGDSTEPDADFRKFLSDLFHTENATFSIIVTTDRED